MKSISKYKLLNLMFHDVFIQEKICEFSETRKTVSDLKLEDSKQI